MDSIDKPPVLSKHVESYAGDGFGGMATPQALKPKLPKPKKPADGTFTPGSGSASVGAEHTPHAHATNLRTTGFFCLSFFATRGKKFSLFFPFFPFFPFFFFFFGEGPKKVKPDPVGSPYGMPGPVSPAARPKPPAASPQTPLNPFDALAGQNLAAVKKMMKEIKAMPDAYPFLGSFCRSQKNHTKTATKNLEASQGNRKIQQKKNKKKQKTKRKDIKEALKQTIKKSSKILSRKFFFFF